MNEAQFILEIRKWTGITDPTVNDDDTVRGWIRMGEELINADLRVDRMIQIAPLTVYENRIDVPDNWIQNDFVWLDTGKELDYLPLAEFYSRGKPKGHYSTSGRVLLVGGDYGEDGAAVELHYFAEVPKLQTTSTWLMDHHQLLYTFAVLVPAFIRTEEPEKSAASEAKMRDMIARANEKYNTRSAASGTIIRRRKGFPNG